MFVTACSGSTSPEAKLSGTYTLQSVDGKPLPQPAFVIQGVEQMYTGGTLELKGTWNLVIDLKGGSLPAYTQFFPGGSFDVSGSEITLVQTGELTGTVAVTFHGTIEGDAILLSYGGETLRFER